MTVGQRQAITGDTRLTEVGRVIGAGRGGVMMLPGRATHRRCGHPSREASPVKHTEVQGQRTSEELCDLG